MRFRRPIRSRRIDAHIRMKYEQKELHNRQIKTDVKAKHKFIGLLLFLARD